MNISERIFDLLKEKGISQKEFSKKTGIAESTISDWKKKGFTPKTDKLNAICTALDISVEELLGSEGAAVKKTDRISPDFLLSEDERTLIEIYRGADIDKQKRIWAYFNAISEETDR